ncbi:hypothetical protein JCM16303_006043, partial [Sporobolomyces ruberrimus]
VIAPGAATSTSTQDLEYAAWVNQAEASFPPLQRLLAIEPFVKQGANKSVCPDHLLKPVAGYENFQTPVASPDQTICCGSGLPFSCLQIGTPVIPICKKDSQVKKQARLYLGIHGSILRVQNLLNQNETKYLIHLAYPDREDAPARGAAIFRTYQLSVLVNALTPLLPFFGASICEELEEVTFKEVFQQLNTDHLLVMDNWKCLYDPTYETIGKANEVGLCGADCAALLEGSGVGLHVSLAAPEMPASDRIFAEFLKNPTAAVSYNIEGLMGGKGKLGSPRDAAEWIKGMNTVCAGPDVKGHMSRFFAPPPQFAVSYADYRVVDKALRL